MASLTDILSSLQQGVRAIRELGTSLDNAFVQSSTVVSSALTTTGSTLTFTSSQAAGFMSVTTSSGVSYYLPLYR